MQRKASSQSWWKCKLVGSLQTAGYRILKKLKMELSYDPGIPLLDLRPKEMKSLCQKYLFSHIYCSVLHNSSDTESTWMPTYKQKKQIWHKYTMAYYSPLKMNEILSFMAKWMDLENIMLNEISQAEKDKPCISQ